MAIPTVEIVCKDDSPVIRCPICGTASQDECGSAVECEHILFLYINELSEFIYISPDLKGKFGAKIIEIQNKFGNPVDYLVENIESMSSFCFYMSWHNKAGQQIGNSLWAAYDFEIDEE
jgi:hypothetical protein